METEVESMVTVPIQQVSSSVPLLILQSSISHLLNQYLLPVKNHSLQLSPPTSALQQSSSVLEMVKSRLLILRITLPLVINSLMTNHKKINQEKLLYEIELESMVTIPIQQASSSIPPLSTLVIDLSPPKPMSPPFQEPIIVNFHHQHPHYNRAEQILKWSDDF
ncbi:hypothetical protein Tco_0795257 [Tanacetum coccineum]